MVAEDALSPGQPEAGEQAERAAHPHGQTFDDGALGPRGVRPAVRVLVPEGDGAASVAAGAGGPGRADPPAVRLQVDGQLLQEGGRAAGGVGAGSAIGQLGEHRPVVRAELAERDALRLGDVGAAPRRAAEGDGAGGAVVVGGLSHPRPRSAPPAPPRRPAGPRPPARGGGG